LKLRIVCVWWVIGGGGGGIVAMVGRSVVKLDWLTIATPNACLQWQHCVASAPLLLAGNNCAEGLGALDSICCACCACCVDKLQRVMIEPSRVLRPGTRHSLRKF
jgi:hypothetical protein